MEFYELNEREYEDLVNVLLRRWPTLWPMHCQRMRWERCRPHLKTLPFHHSPLSFLRR